MSKPFQFVLNWISRNFSNDASKMLITTGVAGWAISSIAQIGAILLNTEISNEKKSFLVPQEIADAAVNIGAFFLITQCSKKLMTKMCKTGKIASKSVREFLNNSPELKSKVGKLDFDIEKVLPKNSKLLDNYETYKSFATTFTTVGAGIISSNIVTPIVRNNMAADMQKNYIQNKQIYSQPSFKSNGFPRNPTTLTIGNLPAAAARLLLQISRSRKRSFL